ncbi:chemotaxis protein CheW [Mastigocladopsis repens]|uniref:chemotaxis protein CheW n=1 Tax=Mastigocladopsis repens TaxID=221287 RepID=UPI00037AFE2B|nr:chemotaxis protein CheW [Mastigocladopsis repens]
MENKKYLTFRIHDLHYGIEAGMVQEIFPLPELIPNIEASSDIIGILNLRTQIVPVIHLDWLQGYPPKVCHLSDYIIILQWEGLQISILVHQVNEMLELDDEVIETVPYNGFLFDINTAFIAGVAKIESETIFLLDSKKLVRQPETLVTLIWDAQSQLEVPTAFDDGQQYEEYQTPNFYDLCCPHTTSEERAIFQQRAVHLRQSFKESEVTNSLMALAVIGIGDKYYGLDLKLVREFTNIDNLTPIPCCPKHIVGNMNLRGEIVTLVDIRNILNLPMTPINIGSKAVVVQFEDVIVGLPVDKVLEVVYLNPAEMTPLPALELLYNAQYLRGMAFFQGKMLSVLDFPKILTEGELTVNEQI